MLRETKHVRPYPNRGIVEDVVSRYGAPDVYSFTPFKGKKKVLDDQFTGSQRSKFRLDVFLQEASGTNDFNPTRAKRTISEGILSEKEEKPTGVFLEDFIQDGVEDKAIEDWIIMLCVGLKTNNTSPLRKYATYQTRTIRNYSEDGDEAVEEKMLLMQETDALSNEEFEEITRELPYLIKSIWTYSKMYQANLFSFAFAYQDIYDRKHRVSITDFRDYPTYLIKRNGEFERQFVHEADNKYTIYPKVTKIFIYPGDHPAEFGLCSKFMRYLQKLGIDYHDEDPLMYNNDFVNSLICTYLPTNDEYFDTYKDVDFEIMVALKPENVLTTPKAQMYMQPIDSTTFDYSETAFFIGERIKIASRMEDPTQPIRFITDKESAYNILEEVMYLKNKDNGKDVRLNVPRQMCTFERSGLLYVNKQLCLIDGKYFGKFRGRLDYKVVLTQFGFAVAIEESFTELYYLLPEEAMLALEEYETNGTNNGSAGWHSI